MNQPGFSFTIAQTATWTRSAACAKDGVGPMFPHEQDAKGIEYAKGICAGCPVRALCLNEALENGERFGIWGGLTADERRTLRRREARKKPPVAQPKRQPVAAGKPVTDVDTGALL